LTLGEQSGSDVYYQLKLGKRLERPVRCPSYIYEIMLECWQWDEKKRPTFYQLVHLLKNFSNTNSHLSYRKSLVFNTNSKNIIQF